MKQAGPRAGLFFHTKRTGQPRSRRAVRDSVVVALVSVDEVVPDDVVPDVAPVPGEVVPLPLIVGLVVDASGVVEVLPDGDVVVVPEPVVAGDAPVPEVDEEGVVVEVDPVAPPGDAVLGDVALPVLPAPGDVAVEEPVPDWANT